MTVKADTEVPGRNRDLKHIKHVIKKAMKSMSQCHWFEVSILLVGEERMKDLNSKFRGKEEATDVLAFPLMTKEEIGSVESSGGGRTELIGDIVICVPMAQKQSEERGVSLDDEMEWLAVHGLLHLFGYDDSTESGEREMAGMAGRILKREV